MQLLLSGHSKFVKRVLGRFELYGRLMRHIMIAFCGFSGVGKDECAGRLVRSHGAIHTGLADPAKRHMADLYGFTYEQLFGPSHFRNAGDPRYPKNVLRDNGYDPALNISGVEIMSKYGDEILYGVIRPGKMYALISARSLPGTDEVWVKPGWPRVPYVPLQLGRALYFIETDHPNFFLSPREALQLYCNLMNDLYLDSWIRKGIEVQKQLTTVLREEIVAGEPHSLMKYWYDRMIGLVETEKNNTGPYIREPNPTIISTFSDFRHRHEIKLARGIADTYLPVMVRVKHPKITTPPYNHRSETEQATIPDSAFDFIIMNDGTLDELYAKVNHIVQVSSSPEWKPLPKDTFLGPTKDT